MYNSITSTDAKDRYLGDKYDMMQLVSYIQTTDITGTGFSQAAVYYRSCTAQDMQRL